jgi:hypothetical protein
MMMRQVSPDFSMSGSKHVFSSQFLGMKDFWTALLLETLIRKMISCAVLMKNNGES